MTNVIIDNIIIWIICSLDVYENCFFHTYVVILKHIMYMQQRDIYLLSLKVVFKCHLMIHIGVCTYIGL